MADRVPRKLSPRGKKVKSLGDDKASHIYFPMRTKKEGILADAFLI
jgi:hypothetical protein